MSVRISFTSVSCRFHFGSTSVPNSMSVLYQFHVSFVSVSRFHISFIAVSRQFHVSFTPVSSRNHVGVISVLRGMHVGFISGFSRFHGFFGARVFSTTRRGVQNQTPNDVRLGSSWQDVPMNASRPTNGRTWLSLPHCDSRLRKTGNTHQEKFIWN